MTGLVTVIKPAFLFCIISLNIITIVGAQSDNNSTTKHGNVEGENYVAKTLGLNENSQRRTFLYSSERQHKLNANKSQRRGLFDNFPVDRGTNTSYLSKIVWNSLQENPPRSIFFVASCILLSAITYGTKEVFELNISYQAMLLLYAMIVGVLSKLHPFIDNYSLVAHMMPILILITFLPVIILRTVFSLNTYMMKKSIFEVVIFGVLGFLIQFPLTGYITVSLINEDADWVETLIFGAICSITDSSEASKVLNESGDFEQISVILDGEVLILLASATGSLFSLYDFLQFRNITIGEFMYRIAIKLIGGIAFGVVTGWLTKFFFLCLITNKVVVNLVIISVAYIIYYMCTIQFNLSAILCVLSYSVMLNLEKSTMSTEDEQNTQNLLEVLTFVSNSMIFIMAGIVATEHVLTHIHMYSATSIATLPLLYVIVFALRFATLSGLSYLKKCVGYDVNCRHIPILVFGGSRGSIILCFALSTNSLLWIRKKSSQFLVHAISLVFFSVLLNKFFMDWAIKCLHRFEQAKVLNMKLALKSICNERYRSIRMLKTRKELAQTNWLVVEEITKIMFPYQIINEDDSSGIWSDSKHKERFCPECRRISILHSQNIVDARQQILKRKKVQFKRCYDQGFMSSTESKTVISVIDTAYDTPEKILEISSIKSIWRPNRFLKCINNELVKLPEEGPYRPPEQKVNRLMFRIFSFKYYTLVVYIINLLSILALIPLVLSSWKHMALSPEVIDLLHSVFYIFFLLFIVDFTIKILAINSQTYFKSYWKTLDFCLLVVSTIDIALHLAQVVSRNFKPPFNIYEVHIWFRGLRVLHLLKIISLLTTYAKHLYVSIDGCVQLRLLSGYAIGQCYIKTQDEIIRQLETIYENINNENHVREVEQRTAVLKELADIYSNYPSIPVSTTTKLVSRQVLNEMLANVIQLNEQGLIDDKETTMLIRSINKQVKQINTMKLVDVFPPNLIVKQVPWLFDDNETYALIMKYSVAQYFQQHDYIINAGNQANGLQILVSGVATTEYVYSEEAARNLKQLGHLPNCDFMMHLSFERPDKHEDVLYPGAVIGELALLTHSKYNYSIRCDTNAVVFHIPLEKLDIAIRENVELEANIWKIVSIRIAMHISKYVLEFQNMNSDTLRYKLQTGFVPKLAELKVLELRDIADYCFLIQGLVINPVDQTVYIAPAFIPETVRSLAIKNRRKSFIGENEKPNERDVKLLIIPRNEGEPFLIESNGFGKYTLIGDPPTELCNIHLIELALKKERTTVAPIAQSTKGFSFFKNRTSRPSQ